MNQLRDWEGCCQRCGVETDTHTMSMYDVALICMNCKDSEKHRDDYENAQRAEERAVRAGNYNFEGVGYECKEISNDPIDW
jgi:hypothetical protein